MLIQECCEGVWRESECEGEFIDATAGLGGVQLLLRQFIMILVPQFDLLLMLDVFVFAWVT